MAGEHGILLPTLIVLLRAMGLLMKTCAARDCKNIIIINWCTAHYMGLSENRVYSQL